MIRTITNILFLHREETIRFILCLKNRQFCKGNKDKHIRFHVSSVGCCLFVTGCLAIPLDKMDVRFRAF